MASRLDLHRSVASSYITLGSEWIKKEGKMRYKECDRCGHRANLPDGVDGSNFAGWSKVKGLDLCPDCDKEYETLDCELKYHANEQLDEFMKLRQVKNE